MRVTESIVRFGEDASLVGIVTQPCAADRRDKPGFVLINSGMIHRIGPNRLYVKAARHLAAAGYPVLRFDLSGLGDSSPRRDTLPFWQSAVVETACAMRTLGDSTGAETFVLAGICSGADISFRTAREHAQVVGTVLINGRGLHGVTDDSGDALAEELDRAETTRYLRDHAFDPRSIRKLLNGSADYAGVARAAWHQLKALVPLPRRRPDGASELEQDFWSVLDRGTSVLLVYSECDLGLKYIEMMLGRRLDEMAARKRLDRVVMPLADHTFTLLRSQTELIEGIRQWADRNWKALSAA